MIVQLAGLVFKVTSPSFYQLSPTHYDLQNEALDISYLGGDNGWCLFQELPTGEVYTGMFPSRDEAIGFIAQVRLSGAQ